MTARECWKKWYRSYRIERREKPKVFSDMDLFGTGVMLYPDNGDPRHIPIETIRFDISSRVVTKDHA